MIIKIGRKNGSSFRGAASYYFHDKAAEGVEDKALKPKTDDRVAFFETRNLVNHDPDLAIDEMWKTAELQSYLRLADGGRAVKVCHNPVKTISMSWHPEQKPTPEQMVSAADQYLQRMGWDEHQAVYIGHNDRPHQHLHIILNRVHPETGRVLSDSHEKNRSTSWSRDYMREHGKEYWTPQPSNENARALPENVIELARPFEKIFDSEEKKREHLFQYENDLLKKEQADERIAFFADGKKLFREARQQAYRQVRDDWKPAWRAYYEERRIAQDFVIDENRKTSDRIDAALKAGDHKLAEHLAAKYELEPELARAQDQQLKSVLLAQQKLDIGQAQKDACDSLRLARDEAYKVLLERQQRERDDMRSKHGNGELTRDWTDTPQTRDLIEQIWAARSINDNRAPESKAPEPANSNGPHYQVPEEKAVGDPLRAPQPGPEPTIRPGDPFLRIQGFLRDESSGKVEIQRDPLRIAEMSPDERPEPGPRKDVTDLTATVIGSVASYLADQLSELITPPTPQELDARARQAEARNVAAEIIKDASDNALLKYVNDAIRHTEDQQRQMQRDQAYWDDRKRRRDR